MFEFYPNLVVQLQLSPAVIKLDWNRSCRVYFNRAIDTKHSICDVTIKAQKYTKNRKLNETYSFVTSQLECKKNKLNGYCTLLKQTHTHCILCNACTKEEQFPKNNCPISCYNFFILLFKCSISLGQLQMQSQREREGTGTTCMFVSFRDSEAFPIFLRIYWKPSTGANIVPAHQPTSAFKINCWLVLFIAK